MKVLVLGASGMLGSMVVKILSKVADFDVIGTIRSESSKRFFDDSVSSKFLIGVDVEQHDSLVEAFILTRPDVVINCIGLVKQLSAADDVLRALPLNSMLPHRLARLCNLGSARLIHISTDCVFSGSKGMYLESDFPDATDLYGRSKYLGEVNYPHAVTLRTSIIGHELQNAHSLLDWFLAQKLECRGFSKAIFSGVPTVILAKIIRDLVIPAPELSGLYHVAASPISKLALLGIISRVYGKTISIVEDGTLVIDRSLDGARFTKATGYATPSWEEMVEMMFKYR